MDRRHFLHMAASLPALSLLGSAAASGDEYRVLICLFINGGNDGSNCLIPTDGAYADYAAARPALALQKASLVTLHGSSAGHTFGMHPSLTPLATKYNEGRLAWIANAGALVTPATARAVLDKTVAVPSFLNSHSDQTMWQQGFTGDGDPSGWAGRGLELLPSALRNEMSAVTTSPDRTLVQGRQSSVAFMSNNGARYWGVADLVQPELENTQVVKRLSQFQFANQYKAEYARSFDRSIKESTSLAYAFLNARAPSADFGSSDLGESFRNLATVLPVFKTRGYKRQVFLVQWGSFDTHTGQRGNGPNTQDSQLTTVANVLAAFDQSMRDAGLDQNVMTICMSEFGRTLRPASGGGSDHAWGNNWFALGGPVAGGQVLGTMPSLVLGSADDCDPNGGGRLVPTTSTDQVGASAMAWLGLPASQFETVFPYLKNFPQKTIGLTRA